MGERDKYILKLYVAGKSANSIKAIENLNKIFSGDFADMFDLEIIDIAENPALAREEGILATPTLARISPEPAMRIIGDFRDRVELLSRLGLL